MAGRLVPFRWLALALLLAAAATALALSYDAAVRRAALDEARVAATRRAALEIGTLLSNIDKFRVLPFVLVELSDVRATTVARSPAATGRLDATLAALARQTGASVLYVVDARGRVTAASNAGQADSFVGYDFRFRPYFLGALRTGAAEYFARGTVTGRPGLFLARRAGTAAAPDAVVVVKLEFDRLERLWASPGTMSMVMDRDGIVVITTDPARRFRTLAPLSAQRREEARRLRQFGGAPLDDAGLRLDGEGFATDRDGTRYLVVARRLPLLGWRYLHLEPVRPVIADATGRVRLVGLVTALALVGLLALAFWAATHRRRREAAHLALESEVSRRTAELTDAYGQLQHEAARRELANRRYRAAREELAQANRLGSIGTITTSVAHEINQPVASIRTAAENGLKLLGRDRIDQATANLTLIVQLTQRIGAITSELLSYARRGLHEPGALTIDEVLDGALMLCGDGFRRAGVALEVVRGDDLPPIHASKIRVEQVLVNILQNALDAVTETGSGRDDPRVLLEVAAQDEGVRFSVHDNGAGISDALGDTVFLPFVTGKRHGTGLGLGISREIVAGYGGTLVAGTSPLGGAVFHAVFPRHHERLP